MRVRLVVAPLVAGGLVLSATLSAAHEAAKVNAQHRVFSKEQALDRSKAKVQIQVTNRRVTSIPRLVCETVITDRWAHPTAGTREFSEDWFLVIRNVPPRTRLRSRKDTIFVSHPELAADPAWQPRGVTVSTEHCHRR
jgi:hypothetical protein